MVSKVKFKIFHFAERLLSSEKYRGFSGSSIVQRILTGSVWSIFGTAVSRIVVLISMILVARIIGKDGFGELGIVQTTSGVVGMLAGAALGSTLTRFVAQYAKTDKDRAGRVIALIYSASIVVIFLGALMLLLASDLLSRGALNAPHLKDALSLSALLMASTALRGIQNGIFSGLERFDSVAKLNILEGVSSLVFILSIVSTNPVVEGVIVALTLSAIFSLIVGQLRLKRQLDYLGITIQFKGCWLSHSILTNYSLPNLLSSLVQTPVLWYCMTLIAGMPNGYSELGIYNAAYQFHGPMIFIPMIFMSVSIPVLVQEWENKNFNRFLKVVKGVSVTMLAISLPLIVLISLFSPWVMSWYGSNFIDGWPVLILLLLAAPFHALSKITSGALLAMNKGWRAFWTQVFWGLLILILTKILAAEYGAVGLSVAFLSASVILALLSSVVVLITVKQAHLQKDSLC